MKKFLSLLLIWTILLSFAACGQTDKSEEIPMEAAGSAVPAAEDSIYPITVTDHAGREVVIEADPSV